MLTLAWPDRPRWVPPVVALIAGILITNLLQMTSNIPLTQQTEAQAILAGIVAATGAVGVTELQRRASNIT